MHLKLTVAASKQVTHASCNAVPLVWGSLRLAPIATNYRVICHTRAGRQKSTLKPPTRMKWETTPDIKSTVGRYVQRFNWTMHSSYLLANSVCEVKMNIYNVACRVLVRSIMHNKIHFTTKHVCYVRMLASYLTAVQISRLLKPNAHFKLPSVTECFIQFQLGII